MKERNASELYIFVGVCSPTELFPGPMFPVFAKIDDNGELSKVRFHHSLDGSGNILEFVEQDVTRSSVWHKIDASAIRKRVGDAGIFSYAIDRSQFTVFRDKSELLDHVRTLLRTSQLDGSPFSGLEVAQYVSDKSAEIRFATSAAIQLGRFNYEMAEDWLKRAKLSTEARVAALDALSTEFGPSVDVAEISDAVQAVGLVWDAYTAHSAMAYSNCRVIERVLAPNFRLLDGRLTSWPTAVFLHPNSASQLDTSALAPYDFAEFIRRGTRLFYVSSPSQENARVLIPNNVEYEIDVGSPVVNGMRIAKIFEAARLKNSRQLAQEAGLLHWRRMHFLVTPSVRSAAAQLNIGFDMVESDWLGTSSFIRDAFADRAKGEIVVVMLSSSQERLKPPEVRKLAERTVIWDLDGSQELAVQALTAGLLDVGNVPTSNKALERRLRVIALLASKPNDHGLVESTFA